jgi:protein-disulfide isomerase
MFRPRIFALAALLALSALTAPAQTQQPTQVLDASALKPPAGCHVAIVEFADYECPACGHENPLIMAAIGHYHIPWVRRDFPLPMHHWSFQAAVYARWFDTQSKDFGDQYRNALFAYQRDIETVDDLRAATEKFARDRNLSLPFAVDPQNKLADAVKSDAALAQRMGLHETPTVFIVTSGGSAPPYTQVTDPTQLYSMIDSALAATPSAKPGKGK